MNLDPQRRQGAALRAALAVREARYHEAQARAARAQVAAMKRVWTLTDAELDSAGNLLDKGTARA